LVPEAERTARAAEEWMRWTMEILAEHEINRRRPAAGLPVLNVITLKWWGRPKQVPTFLERHGLQGTFIGDSAFLQGLARTVGLEAQSAPASGPEADKASGSISSTRLAAGTPSSSRTGNRPMRPGTKDRSSSVR
jgi:2,3-bisphosphoglycerate-independent phosphoglycerate mutase